MAKLTSETSFACSDMRSLHFPTAGATSPRGPYAAIDHSSRDGRGGEVRARFRGASRRDAGAPRKQAFLYAIAVQVFPYVLRTFRPVPGLLGASARASVGCRGARSVVRGGLRSRRGGLSRRAVARPREVQRRFHAPARRQRGRIGSLVARRLGGSRALPKERLGRGAGHSGPSCRPAEGGQELSLRAASRSPQLSSPPRAPAHRAHLGTAARTPAGRRPRPPLPSALRL